MSRKDYTKALKALGLRTVGNTSGTQIVYGEGSAC